MGTYALETSKKYIQLGHEVSVVCPNPGDLPEEEWWNGVEVLRPRVCDLSVALPLFAAEDFRNWGECLPYLSEIVGYNLIGANRIVTGGRKYDIVAGHDWLGILGAAVVSGGSGVPFVFHVHSTEGGRQGGGGSEAIKYIERRGGQIADRVVTVSWAMRDEVARMGVDINKIEVSWNGVDAEKYNAERFSRERVREIRQGYGVGEDEKLALFVGRLTKVKGAQQLARAVPMVLEAHPQVRFVFLGQGELEGAIREILRQGGVESHVVLRTEFVPEELRILHYAACDIAVFPSLYEPFGIVSLEAMSMGKPVVVGAHGTSGFREQVATEGEKMCGVHIDPHDPADIAWGINLLLDRDLKPLGSNARRRVLEEFTWDKVAARTLRMYENVIQGK